MAYTQPQTVQHTSFWIKYRYYPVVYADMLIVYYGAADTVVGVASIPLEEFLGKLVAGHKTTITRAQTISR